MWETWVQSLSWEDLLEKEMVTHSSVLAWKTPWMETPGRLQSKRLQRVRHDWVTSLSLMHSGHFFQLYYSYWIVSALCIWRTLDLCCLCCSHLLSWYFFSSSFCLWCLLSSWGFHSLLGKIFPPGWPYTWLWNMFSVGWKVSCTGFLSPGPAPLLSQAVCVCQFGLRGGDRNSLRQVLLDFRWGEETACLQQLRQFLFHSSLLSLSLFCLCSSLSFSFSLQISAFCLLPAPPQVLG